MHSLRNAFYSGAVLVMSMIAAPILALSARGRKRLNERFGEWAPLPEDEFVWFHGASIGEVAGLMPLMKLWRRQFPRMKILLTATSITGLERGAAAADEVRLLPFDSNPYIRNALKGRLPVKFIFGETELWPALLEYLALYGVPAYLVNARISDRSLARFRRLGFLFRPALQTLHAVVASTQKAASRFVELGAVQSCVRVVGNAKYDVSPEVKTAEEAAKIKQSLLVSRDPVITLGSIRPGEERVWARALKRYAGKGVSFVIAPRHQEKFEHFAAFFAGLELKFDRFTQLEGKPSSKPLLLLDSMGQLERVYSFSDIAFVGGTLVSGYGGHNPLEPAMYSACVALGPYGPVIAELRETLIEEGAVALLRSAGDVEDLCEALIKNSTACHDCGRRAHRVWLKHSGAAARIMDVIAP